MEAAANNDAQTTKHCCPNAPLLISHPRFAFVKTKYILLPVTPNPVSF